MLCASSTADKVTSRQARLGEVYLHQTAYRICKVTSHRMWFAGIDMSLLQAPTSFRGPCPALLSVHVCTGRFVAGAALQNRTLSAL